MLNWTYTQILAKRVRSLITCFMCIATASAVCCVQRLDLVLGERSAGVCLRSV